MLETFSVIAEERHRKRAEACCECHCHVSRPEGIMKGPKGREESSHGTSGEHEILVSDGCLSSQIG